MKKLLCFVLCAVMLFSLSCTAKESTAEKLERAMDYFDAKEYDKALEIIKPEADKGNATAIHYLGWCTLYGESDDIDYEYVKQCFDTALEKGETKAYLGLGEMYQHGWGVEQSYDKAEEYFLLAKDTNYEPATYDLANMYYLDMEKYDEALVLFEELINSGCTKTYVFDAIAKVCYNYFYNGDIDNAQKYFQIGADLGDGNCMNNVGACYEAKEDYEKAAECYEKAIEMGDPTAYLSMGYLYETGLGVDEDSAKALEYYQTAIDKGCEDAVAYYDALAEQIG